MVFSINKKTIRRTNPNLSRGGYVLNHSEMIKAVTIAFCSIQWHFLRYIRAKLSIPTSPYSPDVGEKTEERISDFRISGQSLVKENYHNSRASDIDNQYIDTKLGSVTKLGKTDKKCHCHFPNLWLIWSNPEAGFWTHSPQNLHFH